MLAVGEASSHTKSSSKHKILNFSSIPGLEDSEIQVCYTQKIVVISSVADSDPDPSDPYVFGPPGSGSFYHQAKIVRKTLIPTVL